MFTDVRSGWCSFACVSLLSAASGFAQSSPAAPLPAALQTAQRVFISNAGADSGLFPHPFSGGPERFYDQFYAAVKGMGRFDIVSDPGEAELVLELRLIAPSGPSDPNKVKGASDPLPMFRLTIFDRKSHYALWTLTRSIDRAVSQKSHDRNFDDAMAALALDLKRVTMKSAT